MKERDNTNHQLGLGAVQPDGLTEAERSTAESASSQLGEGSVLCQRYLLMKLLASGGTCDIYQARDLVALGVTGDQSYLVVKVLRDDIVEALGDAGLVMNEALLTRQINHPAVIKIFDYHCDQSGPTDLHFVTMELVEGEALSDLLARTPGCRLKYWHAMSILEPVAASLQAAHEKGIIHSDIKPANILIGHDGQVKVIDFGTARGLMHALKRKPWRKGQQAGYARQSNDRMRSYMAFTQVYASAEVINDQSPAPEDDVFSLACVFHETLSGEKPKTPAAADGDEDTLVGIDRVWRKPSVLNFAQWRVLKKGLAAEKSRRYHSIAEFVSAFKKARSVPKKIAAAFLLMPTMVFSVAEGYKQYEERSATLEALAQSDLLMVQSTQYVDTIVDSPVTSLPTVLSKLSDLPSVLRAGVLAATADQTVTGLEQLLEERSTYNALALSEIGVKLGQPRAGLNRLQRANAEFMDYAALSQLFEALLLYYPDSERLTRLVVQLNTLKNQEFDALQRQWEQLWMMAFEAVPITDFRAIHARARRIDSQRPLVLPEGALALYEEAVSSAIKEANAEKEQALRQVLQLFEGEVETYDQLSALWLKPPTLADNAEKAQAEPKKPNTNTNLNPPQTDLSLTSLPTRSEDSIATTDVELDETAKAVSAPTPTPTPTPAPTPISKIEPILSNSAATHSTGVEPENQAQLINDTQGASFDTRLAALIANLKDNMVRVKPGIVIMGGRERRGYELRRGVTQPSHRRRIVSFRIQSTEVTFEDYDLFAEQTDRALPSDQGWGRGKRPVINVSHDDAVAYTAWLSQLTGEVYRLPSEGEWEYIAWRSHDAAFRLETPMDFSQIHCANCALGSGKLLTQPITTLTPNKLGLVGLFGNVSEWTADCWIGNYQNAPKDHHPRTDGDCDHRVIRGGSWKDKSSDIAPIIRRPYKKSGQSPTIGFRMVRE